MIETSSSVRCETSTSKFVTKPKWNDFSLKLHKMMRKIFEGLQFVLDSSSFTYVPFKKKQKLREDITTNGGVISYILTKKVRNFAAFCSKHIIYQTILSCVVYFVVLLRCLIVLFRVILSYSRSNSTGSNMWFDQNRWTMAAEVSECKSVKILCKIISFLRGQQSIIYITFLLPRNLVYT